MGVFSLSCYELPVDDNWKYCVWKKKLLVYFHEKYISIRTLHTFPGTPY